MPTRPRVIIVGAGFAGLNAAKELKHAPVDVLIVDQHNYHTFQPLLYQVATAGLDVSDVAHQVRDIFRRQGNLRFRQGTVAGVDWQAEELLLKDGHRLAFDFLILAAGAIYHDFGVPGVKRYGYMIKSVSEANTLRSHILRRFERASADPSIIDDGALTFVLVGAGPTGVEMAGALVELLDRIVPLDFPELDPSKARVLLLEMTDTVLPPFRPRSQRYAERVLRKRGVDVRLGARVAEVREREVVLASGESIPTQTLIWVAGVRGHPLAEALDLELAKGQRIRTEEDLSLPGHPDAFAVGDLSGAVDERGTPYPQVAQVAIQQGRHAARTIRRALAGEPRQRFHYADRGMMAIVGRNAGIAELSRRFGGLALRGFIGWLGWLFLHLLYLPGFKNRVSTLVSWLYNYLTYERHARLILESAPSPAEVADREGALTTQEEALATPPSNRKAPADGNPQPPPEDDAEEPTSA
ncbi:MAG: NAD(P)/FAD-dependent oxidoreductase [Deinococcales bacterium]